ncbi:MAG TPA: proline dehydrogenase family protein [Jiangellaceae bacterium]
MLSHLLRRALYAIAVNDRIEDVVRSRPPFEQRAYRAARRYVAGATLDEATTTVRRLHDQGFGVSLDMFGEGASDEDAVSRVVDGYRAAAARVGETGADVNLEIVPSNLGLDLGLDVCRRHADQVVAVLPTGSRFEVSAEESWRTPQIMDLTLALAADGVPVVATLQANLRRSERDAERLLEAGVPVRLVKGAYMEPPDIAYPWGDETDIAFIRLARTLSAGEHLVLATHDPVLREALLGDLENVSVAMLLGVREHDAASLVARGVPVRIYAPFGDQWFRYWLRRVAEAQGA